MSGKDGVFLGLLGAALAALLAPALLRPDLALGNFGDIYAYHHPLRHLAAAGLQAGAMPFWNPYIFAGLPLLANSQTAVFYPGSALFHLFPIGYAFTLHAALHLALAALGMYLLMRALRLEPSAACALSAAFCACPFLIYRIPQGIPTHLAALSYVPWCWLALRSGRAGFLGAVWALQFLSGHPQFSVINAAAMAAYAAADPRVRGKVFLREGVMAGALCLAQGFLTAELIGASNRVGLPEPFRSAYSMPASALATLLRPGFWGDPVRGSFAGFPSEFFEEYALYVGLVPLALAFVALAPRRWLGPRDGVADAGGDGPVTALRGFAGWGWFLAGLGVLLALGRHSPASRLAEGVPLLGLSRVPARFGLLVVWGLLMAAAAGWERLRTGLRPGPRWKAAALAAVLLDLGLWASRFVYAEDPEPYLAPKAAMVGALAGRPVRFASGPELANPNKAMLYRAMNVNGYEAFYLSRYTSYAARAEGKAAADPSRTYITNVASAEMRRLGVAYTLTRRAGTGPGFAVGGETKLYPSGGALPLAYLETASGTRPLASRSRAADRWTVTGRLPPASDGAAPRLVLSVPWYRGWRAWLDGARAPVSLHDGLVQAVSLDGRAPGSTFRADFRFRPTAWTALCLATVLAWGLWLALAPRRLLA
ncbi:MAG: hypothetical protein ABII00_08005 [Elusimicrobiota bacterium]